MPTDTADVCSQGKTGSDRRAVKVTRLTRSGPRSELEVGLVRASLLAHGSRRGLETTRQAVDVPGAPTGPGSRSPRSRDRTHRAKDGTTVEARHTHACDLSRAGRRAIEPAFRWGRTAADPNDRSEREQAQQTNAGLEHLGRLPFQIAARQEMF